MPEMIGRLPYYYFLLLLPPISEYAKRLEDCRIITSFYYWEQGMPIVGIGRLPYYYFLLIESLKLGNPGIGRLPYYYFLLIGS